MNCVVFKITAAISLALFLASCTNTTQDNSRQNAVAAFPNANPLEGAFGQASDGLRVGLRPSTVPGRVVDVVLRNDRAKPAFISYDLNETVHVSVVGPDGKFVPDSRFVICGPDIGLKIDPSKEATIPHGFAWESHEAKGLGKGSYSFSLNFMIYEDGRAVKLRSGTLVLVRQ